MRLGFARLVNPERIATQLLLEAPARSQSALRRAAYSPRPTLRVLTILTTNSSSGGNKVLAFRSESAAPAPSVS
jgi:hypothetical protein